MKFTNEIPHYWHKHRLKQERKQKNAMKSSVLFIAIISTIKHKTKSISYDRTKANSKKISFSFVFENV